MATGSGISGQFGLVAETTVGTAVTVTKFVEIDAANINLKKNTVVGTGLHAGGHGKRLSRYAQTTHQAEGTVNLDVATKTMGLLFKNMLGATSGPTQNGTTTAYTQIHSIGDLQGQSLTMQRGVPQTDGTVKPFTANGCKITQWELSCAVGELLKLALTVDAWNVVTATGLASATYAATAEVFNFSQCTVKAGGTASTTSGLVSIAGGTTLGQVRGFSLQGSNPMKTDRFFFGSAGTKAEQIENDWRTYTGSLDMEFADLTSVYALMVADTTTPLQFTFTSASLAGTAFPFSVDIILPGCKFNTDDLDLSGPDVVPQAVTFEAFEDGTNTQCQIVVVSTDTAL